MKISLCLFLGFSLFFGNVKGLKVDSSIVSHSISHKVNLGYNSSKLFFNVVNFDFSEDFDFSKDFNFSLESIIEITVVILICFALLVVLLTPLLLFAFWIHYSFKYVNEFRDKFSIKRWVKGKSELDFESFTKQIWTNYRKTYSKMIGFGLGIMAYIIASNVYMYQNFNKFEDALFDYFSFPFKVLDNFNQMHTLTPEQSTVTNVWQEMYLIVGISIFVFFIGYYLGYLIVTLRYNKLRVQWQHRKIKVPSRKIILE